MIERDDQAPVLYDKQGPLGWITLNRPEVLNAVNADLREHLPNAVAQAENDPEVRVIIIRGAGERAFSAGADVKEFRAPESVVEARQARVRRSWLGKLAEAAKPSIAAIHGFCLGGGLELALACDIRIASDDTQLGLPEVSLGILPGSGGTQRLSRLVGLGPALHLILTSERIGAEEAYRLGLVTKLVPRGQLLAEAERLALLIASHAPLAVALAKEVVHKGYELSLEAGLRLESDLATLLLTTEDRLEGAAAFREKRKPVYRGR
jgi:enoyl-CoA hydratase/carnithine racemase